MRDGGWGTYDLRSDHLAWSTPGGEAVDHDDGGGSDGFLVGGHTREENTVSRDSGER